MNPKRFLTRTALALALAATATYLADWSLWTVRQSRGTGMGSVHVTRIVVAPLKGNREEYYPDGSADLDCSHSLFPHAGDGPCLWLERHRVLYDR